MKAILLTCFTVITLTAIAHPGIGIVKDSKGFIYYTDLSNIYRIDPVTKQKTIAVRGVHSHELFMDKSDNLYGEHLWFVDEGTNRFDHYLWKLNSNGKLDTLSGPSQAYKDFDFSIARDNNGNEYRVQSFTTDRILRKTKDGTVEAIATGAFKDISWLQAIDNGTVYFSQKNAIYQITAKDSIVKIAENISSTRPDGPGIYGIWHKQIPGALYVAVTSDRMVKKIHEDGTIEDIYIEKDEDWSPTGGVFDHAGNLWVLECSQANEVRVIEAGKENVTKQSSVLSSVSKYRYWWIGVVFLGIIFLLYKARKTRMNHD